MTLSNKNKQPVNEAIEASQQEMDDLKRDMRSAQLTAWAKANQQKIIAGLLALLVLLVGISLWKEHRDTQRASAAALYHQALNAAQGEDKRSLLQTVIKDYDNTVYGGLARLLLASTDAEHAAEYLQAVLTRSDVDEGIRMQARLDLAKLRLNAGDKAAARKLLTVRGGADYEQLRHYMLAQASDNTAERIAHLKKARDAASHDSELSQRIERQLSTLEAAVPSAGQD